MYRAHASQPADLVEGDKANAWQVADQFAFQFAHDQVSAVGGHACCKVRTSGTTWVTSPMADVRNRQIEAGFVMGLG